MNMKKAILLVLTLALLVALAACGGNDTSSGTGNSTQNGGEKTTPPSQTENTTSSPTGSAPQTSAPVESKADEGTVTGFLAHYGLTEDDIKPEHFVEFADLDMDGDIKAGEVGSTGFIKIMVDKDATGEEQVKAWYEKIYGKMLSLSSDGKTYKNFYLEEEYSLTALYESPLWEDFPGTMWAYQYKMPSGDVILNASTGYDYETGIYKMSISVFED
jgi:predicted small secreted protein